jgi:hypothetical protein
MLARTFARACCSAALLAAAGPARCAPDRPLIPMKLGARWVYRGRAEWFVSSKRTGRLENLRWIAEVIHSERRGLVTAAVFRNFPKSSAWYTPGQEDRYTVGLAYGGRFAFQQCNTRAGAVKLAHTAKLPPGKYFELMLEPPLEQGQRIGGDPHPNDTRWCWYVQSADAAVPRVQGVPAGLRKVVHLVYMTNPDEQRVDVVPGLGITRYYYRHHGTTAVTDLRLVSFRPGKR